MVYVDDMKAKFGRMVMCHMVADTTEELLAMADKIGVNRKWIQYQGTYAEHFDICYAKRALAVKNGAKEITWRECGKMTIARRMEEIKGLVYEQDLPKMTPEQYTEWFKKSQIIDGVRMGPAFPYK